MTAVCKTWFCPTDFVLPLCTNTFEPVEGQANCRVCASPNYTNECGCPNDQVDGLRKFRLVVAAGVSGIWAPMAAFYGTFILTNRGSACTSTVRWYSTDRYLSWTVHGTTPPNLIDGYRWRTGSLISVDELTSDTASWNIGWLPACNNTTRLSSTPANESGLDDWFHITLESL